MLARRPHVHASHTSLSFHPPFVKRKDVCSPRSRIRSLPSEQSNSALRCSLRVTMPFGTRNISISLFPAHHHFSRHNLNDTSPLLCSQHVQFSHNSKYILSTAHDSAIRVWDFQTSRCLN
ncbi:hypothetical protein BC826DRAFT_62839 [Russula brevipes]|nr:hypothetical protein BC826DRAFT_62839 [Russula brevipes]